MAHPGDLLRLARQRRGMTQKDAASALRIAQAVISRLENRVIEADEEILARASTVYDVPSEFFQIADPVYGPPVSVHAMLRGHSDVSGREIDMITAELNIRVFHIRRFLENVNYTTTANTPVLDVERHQDISRIAATVRAHWKLPNGPIANLTDLMERAGIVIAASDFGGAQVSGVTFSAPGAPPIVLINMDHPADRIRYTLAHELGHLVMHRFPTASMENEANRFAANFLLPPNEMKQVFKGRKITLELLAALKKEWRVSMQSLLMSAHAIGALTDNQNRYLWQMLSVKGWRLREPVELDFPHDVPTVLPAILRAHVESLHFKIDDLVRLSHLHRHEFERLYGDVSGNQTTARPTLRLVT